MPALIILVIGLLIAGLGWLGLRVRPRPFPPYPGPTPALETVPLPEGLPAPVARYYRAAVGERIPVITSAVITGTADLRLAGLTFPSRFRFTHAAGQGYRHYIESTIFGYPLLKVNERYLDGKGVMELPFGVVENEPKVDSAANLGLWGESVWLPGIFLTDPRVRWEAIDATHARLVVPFAGGGTDEFTVTFDAQTGLIRQMAALRWKGAKAEAKTRWIMEVRGWERFSGMLIPTPAAVIWEDDGQPWLVCRIEHAAYNVDVTAYLRGRGL